MAFGPGTVDVAIRALSPGVNDPTSAREVVVHLAEVLHELFHRRLPPRVAQVDGRRLERPADPGYASYVRGALTPIADASGQHAAVVETLVRACALLAREAPDEGVREELHAIATHAFRCARSGDRLRAGAAAPPPAPRRRDPIVAATRCAVVSSSVSGVPLTTR